MIRTGVANIGSPFIKKMYNLYKLSIGIMQPPIRDTGLYLLLNSSHLGLLNNVNDKEQQCETHSFIPSALFILQCM